MWHKIWTFFVSRLFLRWFGLYPDREINTLKIQKIIIIQNKIANSDFKSPQPEQIVFHSIPEEQQIHRLFSFLPHYSNGFYQIQLVSAEPLYLKCAARLNANNLSKINITSLYNNIYLKTTKARQLSFNFIPKNILVQKELFQFSRLLSCRNIIMTLCYPESLSLTPCCMRLAVKRCGQETFEGTKVSILQDALFSPQVYLKRILPKHKELDAKALPANFSAKEVKSLVLYLSAIEQEGVLAEVHNQLLAKIKKGLRLIGEIDTGPHGFERLKQAISNRLHQSKMLAKGVDWLWSKYPGAAASFLVLSAIYEYRHGDYWDFTLDSINVPCNPSYQRRWGRPFLLFIHVLGLELFP
ncbi:MAG: hypothetical protein ACOCZ6_06180, partial [Nanoarchaeota archaeon]